jgi:hypothetical protein
MNLTHRIAGLLERTVKSAKPGVWGFRIQHWGNGSIAIILICHYRGKVATEMRVLDAVGLRSGKIRRPNGYIGERIGDAVKAIEKELGIDQLI